MLNRRAADEALDPEVGFPVRNPPSSLSQQNGALARRIKSRGKPVTLLGRGPCLSTLLPPPSTMAQGLAGPLLLPGPLLLSRAPLVGGGDRVLEAEETPEPDL